MLQTLAESKPQSLVGVQPANAASSLRQHTLRNQTRAIHGKGLMLGIPAQVVIKPAPVNHGIVFVRTDLNPPVHIPALVHNVIELPGGRRTTLKAAASDHAAAGRHGSAVKDERADSKPVTIETIEHCMSALAGLRIDNAIVEISGPELPCGDGSAAPFVEPLLEAGIVEQDAPRRVFTITEPIVLEGGDAMLAAFPCAAGSEDAFKVMFDLDYGNNSHRIKRQSQAFEFTNGYYEHELARARTYSLREEAQALWERGMCRHLSPREVLVIGDDGQPIDNAFRYDNEPVRHKVVDLIGDLYLIGGEVHGRFVAHRSGHALNRKMCLKILEQHETNQRKQLAERGRVLDIRAIQRIMPHRYPMLLVDRVVEIDGDRRAIGIKNVTINEPFFEGHYPGTPIMPGVLLVEAMAQLGGLLMSQKLEHTGKIAVLLSLDKVKLRKPVTPGDQVVLEAESISCKQRTGTMHCRAFVGSKLAAEAQIRFMMVDAEQE